MFEFTVKSYKNEAMFLSGSYTLLERLVIDAKQMSHSGNLDRRENQEVTQTSKLPNFQILHLKFLRSI